MQSTHSRPAGWMHRQNHAMLGAGYQCLKGQPHTLCTSQTQSLRLPLEGAEAAGELKMEKEDRGSFLPIQ